MRRRIEYKPTFEERLIEEAQQFREAAEAQPAGSTARELLLRRARQAETASHINGWLRSARRLTSTKLPIEGASKFR
jgi:hypothetical protein